MYTLFCFQPSHVGWGARPGKVRWDVCRWIRRWTTPRRHFPLLLSSPFSSLSPLLPSLVFSCLTLYPSYHITLFSKQLLYLIRPAALHYWLLLKNIVLYTLKFSSFFTVTVVSHSWFDIDPTVVISITFDCGLAYQDSNIWHLVVGL